MTDINHRFAAEIQFLRNNLCSVEALWREASVTAAPHGQSDMTGALARVVVLMGERDRLMRELIREREAHNKLRQALEDLAGSQ